MKTDVHSTVNLVSNVSQGAVVAYHVAFVAKSDPKQKTLGIPGAMASGLVSITVIDTIEQRIYSKFDNWLDS